MRIFVGYGYNPRDQWIERDFFPILKAMGLEIIHAKDMHGKVLQDGVKERIARSDALIGFCTLRDGQEQAEFNTHIWVRDEMLHAIALHKPVVEVRERGVKNPLGLIGDRQRIDLDPTNKLKCIAELVRTVSQWSSPQVIYNATRSSLGDLVPYLKQFDQVWMAFSESTYLTASDDNAYKEIGDHNRPHGSPSKIRRFILQNPNGDYVRLAAQKRLVDRTVEEFRRHILLATRLARNADIPVKWFDGPISNVIIGNPHSQDRSILRFEILLFPKVSIRPTVTVNGRGFPDSFEAAMSYIDKMWKEGHEPTEQDYLEQDFARGS